MHLVVPFIDFYYLLRYLTKISFLFHLQGAVHGFTHAEIDSQRVHVVSWLFSASSIV